MKHVVRLSLLVILLGLSASAAYTAGPPDIVTNGDFSNGLDAWTNVVGTTTVGGGTCGTDILFMQTSGDGPGQQANVEQCINLTTDPSGTWTYAVGLGTSTNALSLNANYRFSDQVDCIGASTGGPFTTTTTFPGSVSNIVHPDDALSVEIDIILTEGFSGAATACIDDISFTDSGGQATAVGLLNFGAEQSSSSLWAIPSAIGLMTLAGWTLYRRRQPTR